MKKILNIMVLSTLMACLVPANAQDFNQKRIETPIQSQQIMTTGASYSGTVYEPFSTATPAEQSYTPAYAPGGRRKSGEGYSNELEGFDDDAPEYGKGPSPIGDAVLPMMLMALAFGGVVALRKRKEQA